MTDKQIPVTVNPSLRGDTTSECDMFWNGQIDFDDLSSSAKKEVNKRLEAVKKMRQLTRKETKDG
jgi:hypothetical protein